MNRCPITYELCGDQKYSPSGLKLLSRSLKHLNDLPYTPLELVQMAAQLTSKLSIQGVQPKLSVILNIKNEEFEIVEYGGKYIIKPPHQIYADLPQNEDLTMRLAKSVGIDVPLHGMVYNIDGSLSYFIKRFDRSNNKKIAIEDFSQLLGYDRETKYEASMEKVASVIEKHCTFPLIEKLKLFRLVIFSFLVGNEDMHLKNFSLIRKNNLVELSPGYDLINTTIAMKTVEELALPLKGKKSNFTKEIFFVYFGIDRLKLPEKVLEDEFLKYKSSQNKWYEIIKSSFLPDAMQKKYINLIVSRWQRLEV
ncbi:MAG: HipA domain-containing protein [Parachlamydiales bacterium]|jgi:serine/threonine-protein kinase HipA